jgi:hypothetical protein
MSISAASEAWNGDRRKPNNSSTTALRGIMAVRRVEAVISGGGRSR